MPQVERIFTDFLKINLRESLPSVLIRVLFFIHLNSCSFFTNRVIVYRLRLSMVQYRCMRIYCGAPKNYAF